MMTGEVKKEAELMLDNPGGTSKKGRVTMERVRNTAKLAVHEGGTGVTIFARHALLGYDIK